MHTILVSKCLFGHNTRYDGGNCLLRDDYIARLKNTFKLILICPEVMAGLPTPRTPMEIREGKVINNQGEDLSEVFNTVKDEIKKIVVGNNIRFGLFKDLSPSCGVHKIYDGNFSGSAIEGEGVFCNVLKSMGIKVYSENQIEELLSLKGSV